MKVMSELTRPGGVDQRRRMATERPRSRPPGRDQGGPIDTTGPPASRIGGRRLRIAALDTVRADHGAPGGTAVFQPIMRRNGASCQNRSVLPQRKPDQCGRGTLPMTRRRIFRHALLERKAPPGPRLLRRPGADLAAARAGREVLSASPWSS
jgi:hypothetical protein